jgi:hypothetical protein
VTPEAYGAPSAAEAAQERIAVVAKAVDRRRIMRKLPSEEIIVHNPK